MSNIFNIKTEKFTRLDYLLILLLLIGAVISVVSLFRGILGGRQAQVEYLNSSSKLENSSNPSLQSLIVVDIEGAIIKPGIYELSVGSRLKDVLVSAGGYSELADRSYCEKNLNLAQELKDGQKIYIPFVDDTPSNTGYTEARSASNTVNINTASLAELDTLWGIGPARAETIVKNRPYGSLEEVVSKGGMTKQIFDKNAGRMVVY